MSSTDRLREQVKRRRILFVFATQGAMGALILLVATLLRWNEALRIVSILEPGNALALIALFLLFSLALGFLKFELTDLIFVSLTITACMAMVPLLGTVISTWIAVTSAIVPRLFGMKRIGTQKIDMRDPRLEYVKTFGLLGTYGIPVAASAVVYERIGGEFARIEPSLAAAWRIVVAALVLIGVNNLVMTRVMRSYGYNARKMWSLIRADAGTYLLTVPFAVCIAMAYGALGIWAVVSMALTCVIVTAAARRLAITRAAIRRLLQRLASLSNIGKTISLRFTTDELLTTVYTECKKFVDTSHFSVAVLDERTGELVFELDVQEGKTLPKVRIPLGDGLNSWVVLNHEPLLVGSASEERRLGIVSVADGVMTESWLGVPMMSRDRIIGVISVQSYRKNAFTNDDVLMMTAIANQTAVALENASLYQDLENLTLALEQRVMERTNELRETNLRLITADTTKNQFLANMSHELRTPLNSIIGFSSVLLDRTRETLPPRLYKFLENIRTAGHHLLELINDILDLSKIEAGKVELRPEWFDLHETIASVERVMKGFAAEANVQILAAIAPDVPRVRLDEGRLKQILFNLLSNAIKFSPEGGPVRVNVNSVPKVRSPIHVDSIRIEVADKGVGIAEAEMKRIFEEFYQTQEGRRSRRPGTGLGLSLTRNFVELHYGTIEVRSTPGEGAVFTMHLPVDYHAAAGIRDLKLTG